MNRFHHIAGAALTLGAAILFSCGAFAATSGSVNLVGTVTLNCSLTITTKAAASTLNLGTNQTNILVATINEKCQDRQGYTVTFSSNNGVQTQASSGILASSGTNTDTVAYSAKYDGTTVGFVNGSAVVTDVSSKTGGSGVNKNLTVSFTGAPSLSADTYTDTIVLTLVGN